MKTGKKIIVGFLTLILFFAGRVYAKSDDGLRVAALSESLAEMWLLAGGSLTGATEDALLLPELSEAVKNKNIQSVGTLTTPSLEVLVSLEVNLVLVTKDIPVHKKIRESLLALGKEVYVVDVKNFSDYEKVMEDFTRRTGRSDLYKKNVLEVKERISGILSSSKKIDSSYVFLRVSAAKNKVMKNHFANEIFSDFGLTSSLKDDTPLDDLGMEALLTLDPDYIFVVAQGDEKRGKEIFTKTYVNAPGWKNLTAVKNNRVFFLPKNLFNYKPNANWDKAYAYVHSLL